MNNPNCVVCNDNLYLTDFPNDYKVLELEATTDIKMQNLRDRLCDYQAHYDDLCIAYRLWFELNNNKSLSDDIRYALIDSILMHYFKCFPPGKRKYKLQFSSIIKSQTSENRDKARSVNDKFKDIRNQFIAHDGCLENLTCNAALVAIVNLEKSQPLERILLWSVLNNRIGFDIIPDLLALVQFTKMWVEQEMEDMTDKLTQHYAQFPKDFFDKQKQFRSFEATSSDDVGYVFCGKP